MKIDIGCGLNKQPGYIGIDIADTVDVDIRCDINKGIPLEDNTVEKVIASHSLEHVQDLMFIMKELYRVCKDRATICIVAPYYHTSLNMANPYHKQVFNEHTPRFFTKDNTSPLPYKDYDFPHAKVWALGESDNSNLEMDFRCIKMEFFYFDKYRYLTEEEKSEARKKEINVVDQIMYQFLVVKTPLTSDELEEINNIHLEEPSYVTIRRLVESNEYMRLLLMENGFDNLNPESIRNKKAEIENEINSLKNEIKEKNKELSQKVKEIQEVNNKNGNLQYKFDKKKNDLSYLFKEQNDIRDNRLLKISDVLKQKKRDMSININPSVKNIMSENVLQSKENLDNYILTRTKFIMPSEIIYYEIECEQNYFKGLKMVFTNLGLGSNDIVLGMEILDENNTIIRSIPVTIEQIKHNDETIIEFEPIEPSANKKYIVRFVGLENIDANGISLYVWKKLNLTKKPQEKMFGVLIYD